MRSSIVAVVLLVTAACANPTSGGYGDRPAEAVRPEAPVVQPRFIELRPISDQPSESGAAAMSLNGKMYYFAEPAALDLRDFVGSSVSCERGSIPEDPRWVVGLDTTEEGSKKLVELTRARLGKQIGVFVDGRLVSAPFVQTEIDGAIIIDGEFSEQQAMQLAARIRRGGAP